MDEDTLPIDWKLCIHQLDDGWGSLYNFCPWCGKDLRKEQSNDQIQRTNGRNTEEQC